MRYRFTGCQCCPPRSFAVSRRALLGGAAVLGASALLPAAPAIAQARHRIDVHHHIFLPQVRELQEKLKPGWARQGPPGARDWTPATMLADMDAHGVASVVVATPGPGAWYGDAEGARQISRLWNERSEERRVGKECRL